MGFRVLDNSNINNLTKFKENFIKKFENPEEAEIEYKKAFSSYKKLTKNTKLILLIMEFNEGRFEESSFIDFISKEISKYSHSQINRRNIYDKSAICYVDNLNIFQNIIKSGYEITEKDLHYLKKCEVQAIKNIAENLTIKNSITKEKQKNIVENEQKIKHVNKNVL